MRITKKILLQEIQQLNESIKRMRSAEFVVCKPRDEYFIRDIYGFRPACQCAADDMFFGEIGRVGNTRFVTDAPRTKTYSQYKKG